MKKINKAIIATITVLSIGFLVGMVGKQAKVEKETAENPGKYLQLSEKLSTHFQDSISKWSKSESEPEKMAWLSSIYFSCDGDKRTPSVIQISEIDNKHTMYCRDMAPIKQLVLFKNADGSISAYTDKEYQALPNQYGWVIANTVTRKLMERSYLQRSVERQQQIRQKCLENPKAGECLDQLSGN
jgi:urate oxidase